PVAGGGHDRRQALVGGDVGRHRDQVQVGGLGGELLEAVGGQVGGHDPGPLPGQAQGGGPADAGAGAGDDGGPAGEAAGDERRRWGGHAAAPERGLTPSIRALVPGRRRGGGGAGGARGGARA